MSAQAQQVETQPQTTAPAAPKMAIPNVASLTDAQLRAALKRNGVQVGNRTGRPALIRAAKDAGLWDYRGDVVPASYKRKYGKAQTCGDSVAQHLVQRDIVYLTDVAEANGIDIKRWAHCQYGQVVMNLGNVLRGMIKRGDYVVIGTDEWNPENA